LVADTKQKTQKTKYTTSFHLIDMDTIAPYRIENHIAGIHAKLQYLKKARIIYWQKTIPESWIQQILQQGRDIIEQQVNIRIRKVIGIENPYRDGITPLSGNIIFLAQHATATCCRSCMQQWHNFPKHKGLSEKELAYSMYARINSIE
jgi:hypothetical protein